MPQNAVLIPVAPFLRWFCGDAGQGVGVDDDADDDDGDDEASSHPHLSDLYAVYGPSPCDQLCVHGDDGYGVGVDVSLHLHFSRLLGFLFHLQNDHEILDLP